MSLGLSERRHGRSRHSVGRACDPRRARERARGDRGDDRPGGPAVSRRAHGARAARARLPLPRHETEALMLDDRVRAVLSRLEAEDADERARGVERGLRSRAVVPTTGRFLFALVAPQTDCEVLEIGGSRGYSAIWLAAGV